MKKERETAVYESDPGAAPDSEFVPGQVEHLMEGNLGRLLDERRTPVALRSIDVDTGMFEVEVMAFEDAGARWQLPFEDVQRFQFARASMRAGEQTVRAYGRTIERFGRPLNVECPSQAAERSTARVDAEQARLRDQLDALGVPDRLDPAPWLGSRDGDPGLVEAAGAVLAQRGLDAIDGAFAARYVSNPWSGETIKGHAIVAAELGLFPFHGKVVRDPALFAGEWSKERRTEHIIVRLALTSEIWRRTGQAEVTVYRAAASETSLDLRPKSTFVSATFSLDVAKAHFAGGPATRAAFIHRQRVPIGRLFMSFAETAAMNRSYREAEAVLIGARGKTLF